MLGVAQNAQASLITGVTATLTGTTSNWALDNVTNGSGLTGNKPSLGGTHALSATTNAWRSNNTTLPLVDPISITFKLGTVPQDLIGLSFWNMTGLTSLTAMGVQGANFQYSIDNAANFTALAPTAFNGVAGAWTGSFTRGAFKSIPEPSASLALLGLGLAGVGLRKRI